MKKKIIEFAQITLIPFFIIAAIFAQFGMYRVSIAFALLCNLSFAILIFLLPPPNGRGGFDNGMPPLY